MKNITIETTLDNYSFDITPPVVIIMVGLPGTGKSTVAKYISKKINLFILRSDIIRKDLLSKEDLFNGDIVGNMDHRELIYEKMFLKAKKLLLNLPNNLGNSNKQYNGVILDATFITSKLRNKALQVLFDNQKLILNLLIVEIICPESVAINRILQRTKKKYESNALDAKVYHENKEIYESIELESIKKKNSSIKGNYIRINTDSEGIGRSIVEKQISF